MAQIELSTIRKSFDGTDVLKGIDFRIEDGEFISLVGPSGCGKSTLLRIIAGLEPQNSGQVHIDGRPVDGIRPSARNLAMVFQSYALYPHLSTFDNIAVPLRMRRLSAIERLPLLGPLLPGRRAKERTIRADITAIAEQLDIAPLLRRKPGQLSGGQRQRVAVGRAMVREPRAFLFDEPLSNLDAKLRVHMRAELAELHRRLKATFVYVTHDQAEAMTMSSRIAVMMAGELIQVGTPAEIYDDPGDIRVAEFIGSPKINILPGRVRKDGGIDVLGTALRLGCGAAAGDCRVGVRPERIELGAGPFSGSVVHLENLGAEAFVHLAIEGAGARLIARLGDVRQLPAMGRAVTFGFAPDAVRAFDPAGKRIELRVEQAERIREPAHV
ncbi:glycerol-3-phosphate ABC transporter ATP-binding protein [Bradyrhizobium nitroreducens]|uniref:Glycerol-3-phosphate ABC transporter ATP-binding protein n=1 Tax=Bradyrhizobium nitroreducens TaxID=709803 RepID=A0A2M6UGV1_9BRAD|nr:MULTISPECIES: ABC transporter ATP-binding protein [Bradyrhizobium]PIT03789.1 glycerol-3-phosphate ABC transporter ATP-binding protein [Bradyrhizobium nitroreducens]TQF27720.1 glycerol-3-phosphate ABC transporter ATP-binding protein [Bradyrhizobium sp. UNPF46]